MDDQLNDVLYAAPLESFIAERTRLVGELRKAGDKAGAARVAKAAKPTVSAWAVNQLARREREAMQRLVDAGALMRDAQMSGADRDAFAAATAAHREALGELRAAAERILVEGGHGAAPAVLERVARNLRATGASEELAQQIQAGCLVTDLEAERFDGFAALAGASPPEPRDRVERSAAPPRGARGRVWEPSQGSHREEEQRRARERADRERELARTRRAAEETTVRASRTREAAVRARRAAEEAEAEAAAAETAAAAAREALAQAQRALFSLAPSEGEG